MWLGLGIFGVLAYYFWPREDASVDPDSPPPVNVGVVLVQGAQTFTPDAKMAILAALPGLALEQSAEAQGVKTFRIVASSTTGPNAGAQVEQAILQGQVVGASVSMLSLAVEEHFVAIGFPQLRLAIAEVGSPMALLHDPENPGL